MEEDNDEEQLPDLPEKCPICGKESKNLLLHMKKKESCNSKIDPKLYEYWKGEQNRYSKRKYQAIYIKKGKHNVAQERYMKTSKHQNAKRWRDNVLLANRDDFLLLLKKYHAVRRCRWKCD